MGFDHKTEFPLFPGIFVIGLQIGQMLEIVGVVFAPSHGRILLGPFKDRDFQVIALFFQNGGNGFLQDLGMGQFRGGHGDGRFASAAARSKRRGKQ